MSDLKKETCKPCEGGVSPLNQEQIVSQRKEIPKWQVDPTGVQTLFRVFEFKNYYQTMAFVNAVAWIAHRENHHPDLEVSYNKCVIKYSTHAIQGLSLNDFICAAKVDVLIP